MNSTQSCTAAPVAMLGSMLAISAVASRGGEAHRSMQHTQITAGAVAAAGSGEIRAEDAGAWSGGVGDTRLLGLGRDLLHRGAHRRRCTAPDTHLLLGNAVVAKE